MSLVKKVVSGGQTGADRGGLQAAIDCGLPHGGWCPKGRLAEDGSIPGRFLLTETPETDYRVRTEKNVLESDATVIFSHGTPQGGTALTLDLCRKHSRPFMLIDLASDDDPHLAAAVRAFASSVSGRKSGIVLNIAGSRESVSPGIQQRTYTICSAAFRAEGTTSGPYPGKNTARALLPLFWIVIMSAVLIQAFKCALVPTFRWWIMLFVLLTIHLPIMITGSVTTKREVRIVGLFGIFIAIMSLGGTLPADIYSYGLDSCAGLVCDRAAMGIGIVGTMLYVWACLPCFPALRSKRR